MLSNNLGSFSSKSNSAVFFFKHSIYWIHAGSDLRGSCDNYCISGIYTICGIDMAVTSIVIGWAFVYWIHDFLAGVPSSLLDPGTTIVAFEPEGTGTYELNGITGPLGSPTSPVTFTTQSLLTLTQIVQGASPIVGTIISAPGLASDVAVSSSALLDINGNATGSYFLNTPTAATTGQPNPVTITADLLNVLDGHQLLCGQSHKTRNDHLWARRCCRHGCHCIRVWDWTKRHIHCEY